MRTKDISSKLVQGERGKVVEARCAGAHVRRRVTFVGT
jgi:hypothetical protein